MEQRVVIITGATSGMGEAMARQAAQRGLAVVATGRRTEKLNALAQTITAQGGRVLTLAGDVGQLAEQQRIISETLRVFGRIDILINNAGVPLEVDFRDATAEEIQRQWNTNVTALATLSRLALPELEKHKGTLINIGSVVGHIEMPKWGNYAATKTAVAALTNGLRRELAARGVNVCLVEPGPIATEFQQRAGWSDKRNALRDRMTLSSDQAAQRILRLIDRPRKHITVPGWIAPGILFVGAINDLLPGLVDVAFWLMYRRADRDAQAATLPAQKA